MKTLSMAFYLNSDKYQEIQTELQNFIKKLMKTEVSIYNGIYLLYIFLEFA